MKLLRILSALFFTCLFALPLAFSQDISTQGTEFWVSFMGNGFKTRYNELELPEFTWLRIQLIVSAKRDCNCTITNPNTNYQQSFHVNANSTYLFDDIPWEQAYMELNEHGQILNKGLRISADDTISVYCANIAEVSFDASYILPTLALGNDYIIQTYDQSSGSSPYSDYYTSAFLIVAPEEGETTVDITPATNTLDGHTAHNAYSITLRKGEAYQVRSHNNYSANRDLSGTRVTARDCKKIAVFNGNNLTKVPNSGNDSDCIFEQAMPLTAWGKKFVVTASLGRQLNDIVKITSAHDNNEIHRNGSVLTTLNAGQSTTFELPQSDKSCFIEASHSCAVYLYNHSADNGLWGSVGDGAPSMVWIAPIEQRINEITFSTFNYVSEHDTDIDDHYVNIIVNTEDIQHVYLDSQPLSSSQFESVNGTSEYSFIRRKIDHGAHHLSCANGFNAHVYGFGHAKGYAYLVGSKAADLSTTIFVNGETVQQLDTISSCSLESITFEAEINYQNFEVEWDFGDGTPHSHSITDLHTYNSYGLYEVTLTVTSEETPCQSSSSISQTVYISLNHASDTTIHDNTCYNGPSTYNQHGFNLSYNAPGIYKDTITIPQQGCDSTVYLILEVDDVYDDPNHPLTIDTCNSYRWNDSTYTTSGFFPYRSTSPLGCDSIVYLDLTLSYSPTPDKIQPYPNNGSTVWTGYPNPNVNDTVFVVTNTEFFSFQYTFRVKETKHNKNECLWTSCKWSISKTSWAIDTIPGGVQIQNDTCFSDCTVFIADRDEDYVTLTAIMSNSCDIDTCKIFLKSSFLGIDEQNTGQSDFNIVPNPNHGEMELHLEQLTGKVNIKVYDMRGALVDIIETYNDLDSKTLHYTLEHTSSGFYFFVATAKEGTIAKKVIIE